MRILLKRHLQMPELKIQYCLFPIDSEKPNGIV